MSMSYDRRLSTETAATSGEWRAGLTTDEARAFEGEKQRNAARARVNWSFTTEKARAKMARAYPRPTNLTRSQGVETSVPRYWVAITQARSAPSGRHFSDPTWAPHSTFAAIAFDGHATAACSL
jgi:hypothetical protein